MTLQGMCLALKSVVAVEFVAGTYRLRPLIVGNNFRALVGVIEPWKRSIALRQTDGKADCFIDFKL